MKTRRKCTIKKPASAKSQPHTKIDPTKIRILQIMKEVEGSCFGKTILSGNRAETLLKEVLILTKNAKGSDMMQVTEKLQRQLKGILYENITSSDEQEDNEEIISITQNMRDIQEIKYPEPEIRCEIPNTSKMLRQIRIPKRACAAEGSRNFQEKHSEHFDSHDKQPANDTKSMAPRVQEFSHQLDYSPADDFSQNLLQSYNKAGERKTRNTSNKIFQKPQAIRKINTANKENYDISECYQEAVAHPGKQDILPQDPNQPRMNIGTQHVFNDRANIQTSIPLLNLGNSIAQFTHSNTLRSSQSTPDYLEAIDLTFASTKRSNNTTTKNDIGEVNAIVSQTDNVLSSSVGASECIGVDKPFRSDLNENENCKSTNQVTLIDNVIKRFKNTSIHDPTANITRYNNKNPTKGPLKKISPDKNNYEVPHNNSQQKASTTVQSSQSSSKSPQANKLKSKRITKRTKKKQLIKNVNHSALITNVNLVNRYPVKNSQILATNKSMTMNSQTSSEFPKQNALKTKRVIKRTKDKQNESQQMTHLKTIQINETIQNASPNQNAGSEKGLHTHFNQINTCHVKNISSAINNYSQSQTSLLQDCLKSPTSKMQNQHQPITNLNTMEFNETVQENAQTQNTDLVKVYQQPYLPAPAQMSVNSIGSSEFDIHSQRSLASTDTNNLIFCPTATNGKRQTRYETLDWIKSITHVRVPDPSEKFQCSLSEDFWNKKSSVPDWIDNDLNFI